MRDNKGFVKLILQIFQATDKQIAVLKEDLKADLDERTNHETAQRTKLHKR